MSKYFIFLFLFIIDTTFANTNQSVQEEQDASFLRSRSKITYGWFNVPPYQYENKTGPCGLDTDLLRLILNKMHIDLGYRLMSFEEQLKKIAIGEIDVIAGVSYSKEREKYGYFSVPYRKEGSSLFVPKSKAKAFGISDVFQLINAIQVNNFKLGVVKSYIYGSDKINSFISGSPDKIYFFDNEIDALWAIESNMIDGMLCDNIVMDQINSGNRIQVNSIDIGISSDVMMFFSRKTISFQYVDHFNKEINKQMQYSNALAQMKKQYIYPIKMKSIFLSKEIQFLLYPSLIFAILLGIFLAKETNKNLIQCQVLASFPQSLILVFLSEQNYIKSDSNYGLLEQAMLPLVVAYIFINKNKKVARFKIDTYNYQICMHLCAFIQSSTIVVATVALMSFCAYWVYFVIPLVVPLLSNFHSLTLRSSNIQFKYSYEASFLWTCILMALVHLTFDQPMVFTVDVLIFTFIGILVTHYMDFFFAKRSSDSCREYTQ